jgi:hypothetical protein
LIFLGNLAEREGFIPAPGELVSRGLFELPEFPYLRKYPARTAISVDKASLVAPTDGHAALGN